MKQRLLSLLLCGAMLFSVCTPGLALEQASSTGGLCPHHQEHSYEVCGYIEAVEGKVIILVATGMHRQTTRRELEEKFTPEVAAGEDIRIHDAFAPDLSVKGTLPSGAPLSVNPLVDWADLIAADGFIEPHFFAGFSGGRKSILPGIASADSIRANHCAALIRSPLARTGILEGNPIHRDMEAAACLAGLRFILNVVLDDSKRIVHAVAGGAIEAHRSGCAYCRRAFPSGASGGVRCNHLQRRVSSGSEYLPGGKIHDGGRSLRAPGWTDHLPVPVRGWQRRRAVRPLVC